MITCIRPRRPSSWPHPGAEIDGGEVLGGLFRGGGGGHGSNGEESVQTTHSGGCCRGGGCNYVNNVVLHLY